MDTVEKLPHPAELLEQRLTPFTPLREAVQRREAGFADGSEQEVQQEVVRPGRSQVVAGRRLHAEPGLDLRGWRNPRCRFGDLCGSGMGLPALGDQGLEGLEHSLLVSL